MLKNIEILKFAEKQVKTAKGEYFRGDLSYIDLDSGKTEGRAIMDFTYPDVYARIKEAKAGEAFSITSEKRPGSDGKDYWNWIEIAKLDNPPVRSTVTGTTAVPVKPSYETPKERQARQVLIVRQSSISSAVDLLKDHGKQPDVKKVLEVAEEFVNFVFQNQPNEIE